MKGHRVLLVSSVPLAAPWNGADKNLARLLAMHDQNNGYILQSDGNEPWSDDRIRVTRDRAASPLPGNWQKMKALLFLLRQTRHADLIHIVASIRHPNPLVGRFLRLWKRVTGRPLLHTALSVGDGAVQAGHFAGDTTVVVSEFDRERLVRAGVKAVERLFPPLDWRTLETKTSPANLSAQWQLGRRAILYPGHYGPHGGVQECIAAFARLPRSLDDAVLVLACRTYPGQDPAREGQRAVAQAERLGVAERVRIMGEVGDMAALITACAVTVLLPSRLEGKMAIPLVLLESLALGRPVITGSHPPLNEALFAGGLAVPPGDIPALAEALAQLLSDTNLRQQLGRTGRDAVRQACDPQKAVQQYQQIYARLAGHAA
jgi:glycosyltransferase involved in cell wall biosynthesis